MKKKIILIGAGGHAKSCLEIIIENNYSITGFIDKNKKIENFENFKLLGNDEILLENKYNNHLYFITIGQIKDYKKRLSIFNKLKKLKLKTCIIKSKSAIISKKTSIGLGTIIMRQAILNYNSSIGENCIINNKTLIEHDASIGNNCHISTGSIINGGVKIGNNVFVGSGAVIKEGVKIIDNSIISANSFIKNDIL